MTAPEVAAREAPGEALCRIEGVTLRFARVTACDGVSLELRRGEVHALVGENGAGKSTLMHALVGLVRPVAGRILVEGRPLPPGDPRAARQAGVAMVYQRFRLARALTVAENVVMGLESEPLWLAPRGLEARVQAAADRLGLELVAGARVADLGEGARQRVEILRLLYRGARLLILDEPTSVLTPEEARRLIAWMRARVAEGVGIFLISHKIPEVLAAADRISVLRRGRLVESGLRPAACTVDRLAALMVGQEGLVEARTAAQPVEIAVGEAALEIRGASLRPVEGRERLDDVSLALRGGEIVGVAGVAGNGQRLLAHLAAGLLAPQAGRLLVGGRDLTGRGARALADAGVRYAPEDRDHLAVARGLSVLDNALIRDYTGREAGGRLLLRPSRMRRMAARLVERAGVKVAGIDAPASSLSGGNLQKLVVGRESEPTPRVLIAAQPTQGLDVAAAARVRARLRELRRAGAAVLLISSDLDEVLDLADRRVVMFRGRLHVADGLDREQVGRLMMAGEGR